MKKFEKTTAIIIGIITLCFSITFIIIDKKEFSFNENRYLAIFPKYSFKNLESGKFTNELNDYVIDHIPLRDEMISIKTLTYKMLGRNYINGVYLGKDGYLLENFEGLTNSSKIIDRINEFSKNVRSYLYFMLIPTSVEINKDKLPLAAINESERDAINDFYRRININSIDVYDILMENRDKYLYYKLDHHYTTYGAYYAYIEYCKQLGIEPHSMDEYDIEEVTNDFYGTLYSKTNDYSLKPDSIYRFSIDNKIKVEYKDSNEITDSLYNNDYLGKKDKYSYFLDNNHSLIIITNEKQNGNLLIVKDSYANSFVPFIVSHYNKVHVIDPRYYKESISDYVKANAIDNILFLYNVKTIDNDLGILSVR